MPPDSAHSSIHNSLGLIVPILPTLIFSSQLTASSYLWLPIKANSDSKLLGISGRLAIPTNQWLAPKAGYSKDARLIRT